MKPQQVDTLKGKTIAILATDGVEQSELEKPRAAFDHAGARTLLISPRSGEIQGVTHQQNGRKFLVDVELSDANPDGFDALRGRTLTSWPSLKTDLKNAGAIWVDREVVVDRGLVTSRNPDDLPAFIGKAIEEFKEGRHESHAVASQR